MPERGLVRFWHDDEGWGVIDCPSAPGGCWAHSSAIEMPGFRKLSEGQPVWVTLGDGPQDGYDFLAERVTLGPPESGSAVV